MDIFGSLKATSIGTVWTATPSYQRARNSHVTHHVGQKRNTSNQGFKLLRLNNTGDISSDELYTKSQIMTRNLSFCEPPVKKSKMIMEGFHLKTSHLGWSLNANKRNMFNASMNIENPASITTLLDLFNFNNMPTMSDSKNNGHFTSERASKSIISKAMDLIAEPRVYNCSISSNSTLLPSWPSKACMTSDAKDKLPTRQLSKQFSIGDLNCCFESMALDHQNKAVTCQNNLSEKKKIQMSPYNNTGHKMEISSIVAAIENIPFTVSKDSDFLPENAAEKVVKTIGDDHDFCDRTENPNNMCNKMPCVKKVEANCFNAGSSNKASPLAMPPKKKHKRSRQSRKRRRLKARKERYLHETCEIQESSNQEESNSCMRSTERTDTAPTPVCGGAKASASSCPVSFILGIDEIDNSLTQASYKVSVHVDNEDSVFSEDDCDSNFDISLYQCDFLPNGGDLFNPLNFTFSISLSPPGPVSPFQTNSILDEINASWACSTSPCSESNPKSTKKVRFAEDQLTSVHNIVAWDYAYRAARKGPWEEYARDRQRFQRRIDESEELLAPVFCPSHRMAAFLRQIAPC